MSRYWDLGCESKGGWNENGLNSLRLHGKYTLTDLAVEPFVYNAIHNWIGDFHDNPSCTAPRKSETCVSRNKLKSTARLLVTDHGQGPVRCPEPLPGTKQCRTSAPQCRFQLHVVMTYMRHFGKKHIQSRTHPPTSTAMHQSPFDFGDLKHFDESGEVGLMSIAS